MINVPEIKVAVIAVSRDCFPMELSQKRRKQLVITCKEMKLPVTEILQVVENEYDVLRALKEIETANVNALCIYLGNFGPEGPTTLLAKKFNGPVMFAAAAEESSRSLMSGRGDAYCGMLNTSYNTGLRGLTPYIPEYPVGSPEEVAFMVRDFIGIARIIHGIKNLKVISFGPRPQDFLACNAPIKPLFDLGVEIMENSELDLFEAFNRHQSDTRIPDIVKDMEEELGQGNRFPSILSKLAQYELTLQDWADKNIGMSKHYVFANKCWPAFQTQFGFVPCYVNSRFASRGVPIACETDIYGALSEYILTLASLLPATLLDVNNTIPEDMYEETVKDRYDYMPTDLFMGFHCGNTPACMVKNPQMKYQLIMHRLLEPDSEPDISRGTLEGTLKPSHVTLFRLQSTADCILRSYIAHGEILDVNPLSFGSIGVIGIREMKRFYRHVLIEKRFPHHAGLGLGDHGFIIYEALKMLGVADISFNQPTGMLYPRENPFQ
ncbi:MAG: fucose isomerase [Clostridia bacterium]